MREREKAPTRPLRDGGERHSCPAVSVSSAWKRALQAESAEDLRGGDVLSVVCLCEASVNDVTGRARVSINTAAPSC